MDIEDLCGIITTTIGLHEALDNIITDLQDVSKKERGNSHYVQNELEREIEPLVSLSYVIQERLNIICNGTNELAARYVHGETGENQ